MSRRLECAAGRSVAIDDGRGKREVSYNRAGYPTEVKDAFGNVTKVCYNTFNVPVKVIDANGIVTEYKYSDSGLVASVVRKDGAETIASVSVAYDKNGLPVSYVDQDGLVTSFDRDAFGRVLKEKFADGSEVAYTYDAFGRLVYVDYGNGESEKFAYDHFGRIARQTVDGSLIDYEYTRRGQLAYCNNGVTDAVDLLGCSILDPFGLFGDDDPVVGKPTLVAHCYGEATPIPGLSGTDVWCKGTKPDHIDIVLDNNISLNVKVSPDTKSIVAGLAESVISALTGFLAGLTVTVDVKAQSKTIQIETWVCDAHDHTLVTSRRGMANVRVMVKPYIDIYMVEHESGKCTFDKKVNSWSFTCIYDKIRDCKE